MTARLAVGSAGVEGPCTRGSGRSHHPVQQLWTLSTEVGAGAGSRMKRAAGGQGAGGNGRGDQNSRHVRVGGQTSEIHHPKRI